MSEKVGNGSVDLLELIEDGFGISNMQVTRGMDISDQYPAIALEPDFLMLQEYFL